MISNLSLAIFACALLIILIFIGWSLKNERKRPLLHKLYLALMLAYVSWVIPLMCMRLVAPSNTSMMFFLDCMTAPGGSLCSPIYLCIAVSFVEGHERMQKWMKGLFVLPLISILVTWTNPLHHLQYVKFSVVRSEIVFGPYVLISGAINYCILIAAVVYMIRFVLKNKSALYWKQCILFTLSGLCPLAMSAYATFSGKEVPITATPLSFMVTLILNGIAIYMLHMLDITPIATKHILDAISDGYLVLSDSGLVLSYNKSFEALIANEYGIVENRHLSDCVKREDGSQKTVVYNMLTAIESSRQDGTLISYEQAIIFERDGKIKKNYFVVDVSPLEVNGQISGFAVLFKDITQLRESMQKLQDSQQRMMEQERLAFLGQMIGGLAHNLKTPIMSISGCIVAAENLVEECEESLEDPQVTEEDFREIYGEIRDWFSKVKESTAYMSDIITAIKGQAANISTDEKSTFTIEEMLKRSMLLMRHELLNSGCRIKINVDQSKEISLQGDINNLIQVLDNLLSNAIFAQKQVGGGEIEIEINHDAEKLHIAVKDGGPGLSPSVKEKLFKTMVTSKGAMGTGLGLYISNAVIRGKFNGNMWVQDRIGGGCIFGISIPLELVHIRPAVIRNEENGR
jgi:signal transduction histidine kinase